MKVGMLLREEMSVAQACTRCDVGRQLMALNCCLQVHDGRYAAARGNE